MNILQVMTAGPSNPKGSNMDAIADITLRFVIISICDFMFISNLNLSDEGCQTRPKVLTLCLLFSFNSG
jgi:hypothetical protein